MVNHDTPLFRNIVMTLALFVLQIYLISVVCACYSYLKEKAVRPMQNRRCYNELDVATGDTEVKCLCFVLKWLLIICLLTLNI